MKNKLCFRNRFYGLDIDEKNNIQQLRGLQPGNVYADGGYLYFLKLKEGSKFITSHALSCKKGTIETEKRNVKISISGIPDFGSKSINVRVEHEIILYSKENFFEEKVVIENLSDKARRFEDLRFGFNSHIKSGIRDSLLIAVPFGYPDDAANKKILLNSTEPWISNPQERYTVEEFKLNNKRCGAEGWLMQGKEGGLLIVKHSPNIVEYSVVDSLDSTIRFGGVGIFRKDPEEAYLLPPKGRIEFGVTRYIFYRGDWKEGFYQFREYMSSMGHAFKKDYNPPIHWNVIYNLGWKKYSLKELEKEAILAGDMGCESIYLDPCWNTIEGGEIWDEGRFRSLKAFVSRMKNKYNLKVALHTMSNVGPNCFPDNSFSRVNKEYPGCFRKDSKGNHYILDGCWAVCQGASEWKKEKLKRLKKMIEDGVEFLMFDFCLFDADLENYRSCWDNSHGHKVPLTKSEHIKGMMEVIQEIKEEFPHVLIEAHDGLVGGRYSSYHPLYLRYNWPNSFDELWGFENMWDPLKDILTGNGRTLYYYNLTHKIPLYLHIDCGKDNLAQLEFWWYASTVRHLGIGGVKDPSSPKYKALKEAMKRYKGLKDFYTRGEFYGIDETIHIHTLAERNEAVINAFNLGAREVIKRIEIDLSRIGLNHKKITGVENLPFEKKGRKLFISLKIPSLSPVSGRIR